MLNFGKRLKASSVKDEYPYPALILSPREENKNSNIAFSNKAIKGLGLVQNSDAETYPCYVTIARNSSGDIFIAALEEQPKLMHTKRIQRGKPQLADSYMHDTIVSLLALDNTEENVVALLQVESIATEEELNEIPSELHGIINDSKWFAIVTKDAYDIVKEGQAITEAETESISQPVTGESLLN